MQGDTDCWGDITTGEKKAIEDAKREKSQETQWILFTVIVEGGK